MGTLTDRHMQSKPTNENQWLIEDGPKGHGRFMARITKSGDRLFYFRYTTSTGKRVFLPLGAYDPRGIDGLTLAQARAKAGELSKLYQSGIVDLKEYLAKQSQLDEARRQAEHTRLNAEQEAHERLAAQTRARITVADLFERWAEIELCRHKDGGKEIRRMFNKDVLPTIGHLAVEDVRKGHITEVTDALLKRGVERMAKLIFSLMRQMFRFAVDRDLIEHEPTSAIRKAKIGGRPTERERVLSEEELRALKRALPSAKLAQSTELAIWLMLSTCCRIGELLQAKWEHIDFNRRQWRIPPEHSKNGKPHTVYLSDLALQKFQELNGLNHHTHWCYPSRDEANHVCVKTVTKQLIDRQRNDDQPMSRRSSYTRALQLTGGKWTSHDLRRTGATLMVALGVIPEVAERCLNHIEENRIKRTYQRHSYENEMRDAWDRLGRHLTHLIA
ncbi:MAG TPA: tyrosine-type recombinase/integrase [Rhodocyclaceae bacterium]|nr:tyrosine-type recombinase/integrase [Rhodocyclaceae bacterium]